MKKFKRFLSLVLVLVIAMGLIGVPTFVKADEATNTVTVIVKNDTYSVSDGAIWDGELLNVQVDVTGLDTLTEVLQKAFDDNGIVADGLEYGYVSGINGLDYYSHPNGMGGFMSSINGWFTASGISDYTFENGGLRVGDVITFEYSTDWGADVGSDWQGIDTSLASLSLSDGELDNDFASDTLEYVLTLTDVSEVKVNAIALNRNFQVRIYKNDYTPDSDDYFRATDSIPVETGDTLWIGVGDTAWPTMNYGQTPTVYKLDVNVETSRKLDELTDEEAEKVYASLDDMYKNTYDALSKEEPGTGSIGGEWMLLSVKRSTFDSSDYASSYLNTVSELVKNNNSDKLSATKATDNARVILALNALGYDPSDIEDFNLYAPLSDMDYVTRQGVNGSIWTLIALDSCNYEGDRTALIDEIKASVNTEGAFTFDGTTSDADLTAMALIALAPYKSDASVAEVIDAALTALSNMQSADASFGSVETNSQVLMALSTLGVDCVKDSRFIKNNLTVIDAIATNYLGEGKFAHAGNEYNQMATEQALLALDAYKRMEEGKTTVYDMSDVAKITSDAVTDVTVNEAANETTTPNTGDVANMFVYELLLVFAGAVLLAQAKRKNNN